MKEEICVDCEKPIDDCTVSTVHGKQEIPRCFDCFLKYAEKKKQEIAKNNGDEV